MGASGWSLAVALVSVNAACATAYRPEPQFTAVKPAEPEAVAGTPLQQVWTTRAVRGAIPPVALDSVAVYLAGSSRGLAAVDLASGRNRWSVRLNGPLVGGVLRYKELVIAGTDRPGGSLYALQALSGNELWHTATGEIAAPLTLAGGLILASNRKGELVGVTPEQGKLKWRRRLGQIRTAPVAVDSTALVVATLDSVFRVSLADGQVLARRRAPGVILSSWVLHGSEVLAGSTDSLLVALDAVTLATRWSVKLDAPVLTTPCLRGDTAIAVTRVGTLYRVLVEPEPHAELLAALEWPVAAGPIPYAGLLLLGGADGVIRALDATGAERWRLTISRPADAPPVPLADGFLTLGGLGDLRRFREDSVQ